MRMRRAGAGWGFIKHSLLANGTQARMHVFYSYFYPPLINC